MAGGKKPKYYVGNYEEEVVSGNTRKLHYIYGGNGLAAIMEYKNDQENLYYTFSDYQGNLLAVTNTEGTERFAYDPWGARRNPDDWTQPDTRPSLQFSRGYTMHSLSRFYRETLRRFWANQHER